MKIVFLLIASLATTISAEHPRSKLIMCGARLAMALEAVCNDNNDGLDVINRKNVEKHDKDQQNHEQYQQYYEHDGHVSNDWKGHVSKRETPSLFEECCLKPCHFDELASYCP